MIRPATLALLFTLAAIRSLPAAAPIVTSLPEVTSTAAPSGLLEQQPADNTGRPDWTSARRFPTTRVYLQDAPGEVSFEQWVRHRNFRDGTKETRFQEEIEIGLPHRFQIDIYETWLSNEHRRANQDEFSFELRYALADWGRLPLNPTLYVEYTSGNHKPNAIEGKLLLGQDLTPVLHYGFNFAFEQETSGPKSSEYTISQGIGYTLIDQLLSVGAEMEWVISTEKGARSHAEQQFLVGPSVQIRPTRNTHLDLVGLIGTNNNAPNLEGYIVFGVDFGKIGGETHGYQPVSLSR